MNTNLIFQLVELALSLAQSELDGSNQERALLDIISKGVKAYEEEIGVPVDPQAVGILVRV